MRGDPPGSDPVREGWETSTPHARGSTSPQGEHPYAIHVYPACAGIHRMGPLMYGSPDVYPACAGIHLRNSEGFIASGSLPRMRGDPPSHPMWSYSISGSTPHARGSTVLWPPRRYGRTVYPACAGIHRFFCLTLGTLLRLPRMRGDPPYPQRI